MNEIRRLIYETLGSATVAEVEHRLGVKTSPEQLLVGLAQASGVTLDELAERDLALEEIVDLYRKSDVFALSPSRLAEVHFDDTIIPPGTSRARFDHQIKHKGEIWVVHRNDMDPFPSSPHAHNYEANLKLHLGTGDLYFGRKITGRVGHKVLAHIRSQLSAFSLPPLSESAA